LLEKYKKEGIMKYSFENYKEVINQHLSEWSRDSQTWTLTRARLGKGCFIWDSEKDEDGGRGIFCMRDIVKNYLKGEIAKELAKMIDEANHELEVVVALVFEDKTIGLRLWKDGGQQEGEVVPPIVI
jgi:hypothetical protein